MADFDVAALALASPPTSTPPATYTPAISVRNNGLHDAIATGWLTFYRKSTGVLVAQFNVASGTIHAGATGNATADGTLDLSAEPVGAQFIVTGYVTTTNDQVESNNPLAPVIITISAEPPPPPPPVAAHASQHEEGGGDELHVDGLHGKLLDPQEPEAHALEHQVDGDDELDVTGLTGVLAEGQTPKLHANEAHAEAYITSADIPTEGTAERWIPRSVAADDGQSGVYYAQRSKANIGGALARLTYDQTSLYNGASASLRAEILPSPHENISLTFRFFASLHIIGNAALDVEVHAWLDENAQTRELIIDTLSCAADSDLDSVIISGTGTIHQRSSSSWGFGCSSFALYPAGPSVPNQRRWSSYDYAFGGLSSATFLLMTLTVPGGDANNYMRAVVMNIEVQPSSDEDTPV